MSELALSVTGLSKSFYIDHRRNRLRRYRTLRDDLLALPRRLLTTFSRNGRSTSDVLWPVRDVSLQVKRGEVMGIMGGNVAGKSTLLKVVTRITAPTTGGADGYG